MVKPSMWLERVYFLDLNISTSDKFSIEIDLKSFQQGQSEYFHPSTGIVTYLKSSSSETFVFCLTQYLEKQKT